MDLKELEKQAYDMMLLNPNSEQYKQVRAYINQIKDKEIELTKEFAEKLKNKADESLQDSDIEDEYLQFFNEGRDYGAD
jgi:geranylgeranyl pyrophosphate synthase